MATASTDTTRRPHPTITYPSVHLDSFSPERLNDGSFPSSSTGAGAGPSRLPRPPNVSLASDGGGGAGRLSMASSAAMQPNASASSSSSSTSRPPPQSQPTLVPPTHSNSLGLPQLPNLSPISPLYDLPPDSNGSRRGSADDTPLSATMSPPVVTSPAGPRAQSGGSGRLGGPSLSIHIPKSPQPTRSVPSLRDSPGIPRRRTIVEHEGYQGVALDVESSRNHSKDTPRRLEKKASTNDLKHQPSSPSSSPTARRSLPRPPETLVMPQPHTSTTWPVPNSAANANVNTNTTPKASRPQHQPQKSASASILPVVGGLADAGPYPSAAAPRLPPAPGASGVGIGKPPVKASAAVARAPVRAVQEEICLECMMRDRDLADVVVSGPGAWARQSDADWDELRWREEALLKSMGSQSSLSLSMPMPPLEADQADQSSDSESTSASLVSTGNSMEDNENRRRLAIKKHQRSLLRARRREADGRIAREVGWRGFKWEEGKQGEGLPRGFRGTVGGRLTESGIKAVMTKYPKASEHRYEYLHKYLAHQWKLVIEIRSEASRRGHYAMPSELAYNDSVSSHEPIAAGPRTSSISWDREPITASATAGARESLQGLAPPAAVVRPSPSTPTHLASARPIIPTAAGPSRPHTQLMLDTSGERTPHSGRSRYEKGISSPGTLERSPQPDRDRWNNNNDTEDDALWSPVSAGDGSLRPFSFAVRAGAAAARDGEAQNGRKSLWGRWGGSVTSFFGGSQGGSGSMMDMHLGLDTDRRNAPSHQVHNNYSRAVSMASPSRPSFFSRESRTSVDQPRDPRALSKSVSSSRLSQVVRSDDEGVGQGQGKAKKKGIKGLIQKIKKPKPKAKRQSSASLAAPAHSVPPANMDRRQMMTQTPDSYPGTPLAPPPNMAYLTGQGQGGGGGLHHNRNGSSSSVGDSQGSSWKMRSVSAPIGGSSSGSLSASPTSSKFRRESYNSNQHGDILQHQQQQYPHQQQPRGSIVEVLHGAGAGAGAQHPAYQRNNNMYPSHHDPQPQPQAYEDPRLSNANGYPHPSFAARGSRQTAGSISNSSGIAPTIETPPMPLNQTPFFSRPPSINSPGNGNGPYSPNPNRFKNLPPLPPSDSPLDLTKTPSSAQQQQQRQPRVSYDRPTSTPRVEASPRMAHSMYVQPTAGGSTGSFQPQGPGRYQNDVYGHPHPNPPFYPQQQQPGSPSAPSRGFVESDRRSLISKKGLKGFFGGAKGGRMA